MYSKFETYVDMIITLQPRPLNIILKNTEVANDIIRKKHEINLGNLIIRPDRTQYQLDQLKCAQNELKTRIGNGESNIKILYRNGRPTIVKDGLCAPKNYFVIPLPILLFLLTP